MTDDSSDKGECNGIVLGQVDLVPLADLIDEFISYAEEYNEYVQAPNLDRIAAHDLCLEAWCKAKDIRREMTDLNLLKGGFLGTPRLGTALKMLWEVLPEIMHKSCPDLGRPKGLEFQYEASIIRNLNIIVSRLREPDTQPAKATTPPSEPPAETDRIEGAGGGQDLVSQPDRDDGKTTPAKKRKRSTKNGGAKSKLVAALTKHHKYEEDSCLNQDPIGCNVLAKEVKVSQSTASLFFKKEFKGYDKYCSLCHNLTKLIAALKMLNQEFSPYLLYGSKPSGEGEE